MDKPGIKAAADAGLNVVVVSDDRLAPPDNLLEEEKLEWKRIVNSLPANYFRAGDVQLLRAYVTSNTLYQDALAVIRANGGSTIVTATGSLKSHPAMMTITSQAAAMSMLAAKLRLCPSARMVSSGASTANKKGGTGKESTEGGSKPWETVRTGTSN